MTGAQQHLEAELCLQVDLDAGHCPPRHLAHQHVHQLVVRDGRVTLWVCGQANPSETDVFDQTGLQYLAEDGRVWWPHDRDGRVWWPNDGDGWVWWPHDGDDRVWWPNDGDGWV